MRKWYDGYLFGNKEVYNPWRVVHFTEKIVSNENALPTVAWSNTSSNRIERDLIERADTACRQYSSFYTIDFVS